MGSVSITFYSFDHLINTRGKLCLSGQIATVQIICGMLFVHIDTDSYKLNMVRKNRQQFLARSLPQNEIDQARWDCVFHLVP